MSPTRHLLQLRDTRLSGKSRSRKRAARVRRCTSEPAVRSTLAKNRLRETDEMAVFGTHPLTSDPAGSPGFPDSLVERQLPQPTSARLMPWTTEEQHWRRLLSAWGTGRRQSVRDARRTSGSDSRPSCVATVASCQDEPAGMSAARPGWPGAYPVAEEGGSHPGAREGGVCRGGVPKSHADVTGDNSTRARSPERTKTVSGQPPAPGRCFAARSGARRSEHHRDVVGLALPVLGALNAELLYLLVDAARVGHPGMPQLAALSAPPARRSRSTSSPSPPSCKRALDLVANAPVTTSVGCSRRSSCRGLTLGPANAFAPAAKEG
jgi:hypothetical protein